MNEEKLNILTIKQQLVEKYNCEFVSIMKYLDNKIIKAFDMNALRIEYKYFIIEDNNINEITDKDLLTYLINEDSNEENIVY